MTDVYDPSMDQLWIDTIKPGDLLAARLKLSLTEKDSKLIVEKGETLLVLMITTREDRVSFNVLFRGRHFLSGMEKRAFVRAFETAARFSDAVA